MPHSLAHKKPMPKKEPSDRRVNFLFVAVAVLYIAYQSFVAPKTLGGSWQRSLLLFGMPVIVGNIIAFYWLREKFRALYNTKASRLAERAVLIGFTVLAGAVGGYLVIGFPTNAIFDQLNIRYADQQSATVLYGDVYSITAKSRNRGVHFNLDGKRESFHPAAEFLREHATRDRDKYRVRITARKGLLGTWMVEEWELEEK